MVMLGPAASRSFLAIGGFVDFSTRLRALLWAFKLLFNVLFVKLLVDLLIRNTLETR